MYYMAQMSRNIIPERLYDYKIQVGLEGTLCCVICYFNYYDGIKLKLQCSKIALQSLKRTQALYLLDIFLLQIPRMNY